jgi:CheY-like chemotaxis protein
VDTAHDAVHAYRLMSGRRYRLVVCDIMMPDVDGFQVLEHVRTTVPDLPVIMSTGFSTVENAVQSLYAGAIDFIPKPFTADELLASVRRGFRYREIRERQRSLASPLADPAVFTVPCPPRYHRLGYGSWVVLERDGSVLLGATHMFVQTLDEIQGFDFFAPQDELVQGMACVQIRTATGITHALLSPVSGRVVEANTGLAASPASLEKDPYFGGWLYRAIPTDVEYELAHLTPCSSDS